MDWRERQSWRGEGVEEKVFMNGHLATRVQGDVWASAMTKCHICIQVPGTAEGGYVNVCGSCHWWGPWSGLQPGAMLVCLRAALSWGL